MILVVGNTKGGVGKTTIAFNVAVAFALSGRSVHLVDADSQGTTATAAAIRAAGGYAPPLPCSACADGAALREHVAKVTGSADDVVIDAGGRDSAALRAALLVADVLLVPFLPRSFDVWALRDVAALVAEAEQRRPGLRAFAFLNAADAGGGQDNEDAAASVAEAPPLVLLDAPLSRRKAFANAAGSGRCVLEMRPKDAKACAELAALVAALDALR